MSHKCKWYRKSSNQESFIYAECLRVLELMGKDGVKSPDNRQENIYAFGSSWAIILDRSNIVFVRDFYLGLLRKDGKRHILVPTQCYTYLPVDNRSLVKFTRMLISIRNICMYDHMKSKENINFKFRFMHKLLKRG